MSVPQCSPYDWLVFDLGGVLVELGGVGLIQQWSTLHLEEPEIWQRWMHSSAVRAFETGKSTPQTFARDLILEFSLRVDADGLIDAFREWVVQPFPGAVPLLSHLSRTYPLACLSNTNELHWPRIKNEMGLGLLFNRVFLSHELGMLKPDADIFTHVIESLEVKADRIFYVDDNAQNVAAACSSGMDAFRVQGTRELKQLLIQQKVISDEK